MSARPSPEAALSQILFGGLLLRCVVIAAELGLADHLADGPRTVDELAAVTGAHAPSLMRVLRTLAGAGIFAQRADGRFESTPASGLLAKNGPRSMRDFVLMFGEPWMWNAWGALLHTVKTGECAHFHVQGMSSFDYFKTHERAGTIFNRAMSNASQRAAPDIVAAYDGFSAAKRVMDVGGGQGFLLSAILRAHAHLRGVLFDLPYVIEGAGAVVAQEDIGNRIDLVGGDFFAGALPPADVIVLKNIIHDWDDEHAIALLRNVAKAMSPGGRVLVVEMVVPDGNRQHPAKLVDIMMLAMETGHERTEGEYRELIQSAGLTLSRVIPTESAYSIIESQRP